MLNYVQLVSNTFLRRTLDLVEQPSVHNYHKDDFFVAKTVAFIMVQTIVYGDEHQLDKE